MIFFFILAAGTFLVNSLPIARTPENARLPDYIWPTSYKLHLKTYLPGYNWPADEKNLTTEGFVEVNIFSSVRTNRIELHSDGLEIKNISIKSRNPNLEVVNWELTEEIQFLIIHLNQNIPIHESIKLEISFNGKIRTEHFNGYYLTRSDGSGEQEMVNAVTQFETIDARKMVPCFDEPAFKATWQVTLEYPVGAVALTNTIEVATMALEDSDFQLTVYKETVPMSSYLLAIFIGDVKYKEATTEGLRIRVYTEPSRISEVDYALNISQKVIEGFETLFGIDFPMEKIDFVSVNDFNMGAMENWGLIVHRENALLGENDGVTITVIHEIAHQWFGNLVTTQFWDEVWLNEGFASYMETIGQQIIIPTLDLDWAIVRRAQYVTFSTQTVSPLKNNFKIETGPTEIGISDTVYEKGSSFIRMLEKMVGFNNFFDGIRDYLSNNEYQNVNENDLYNSLSPYFNGPSGKSLADVARCWTHQNGYPVIRVEKKNNSSSLIISQRTPEEFVTTFGECGYKWDVPIFYQKVGEEIELVWLERDQKHLELEVDVPVIINANSNGLYTVDYSDEVLASIANNPELENVSNSTKFRLLRDANTFFDSTSCSTKLDLVERLNSYNDARELGYLSYSLIMRVKSTVNQQEANIKDMLERIEEVLKAVNLSKIIN